GTSTRERESIDTRHRRALRAKRRRKRTEHHGHFPLFLLINIQSGVVQYGGDSGSSGSWSRPSVVLAGRGDGETQMMWHHARTISGPSPRGVVT
ncbi:hypothetical protein RSAG8_08188, partial [Rhizoctonia solani AG-8 WAC10335]